MSTTVTGWRKRLARVLTPLVEAAEGDRCRICRLRYRALGHAKSCVVVEARRWLAAHTQRSKGRHR